MGVAPLTIQEYLEIEAIKKLRSLYSHYFDGLEIDKLAMLFTEDAVCEFGPPLSYGNWRGRDEIREKYRAVPPPGIPPFSYMHAITNAWVELTGPDSATGRWYLLDLVLTDKLGPPGSEPAPPVSLVGVYNDRYKKVNGDWFIHWTRIDHIWMAPGAVH